MNSLRNLLSLIVLSLLTCALAAGDMRYITMRDGLSSRQVYELEEDNDGYIWMYTNSGLERYDGYRFRHYSLDDSEESNDHIASATTMRLGPDGVLWVATKSGVIYSYDKEKDRFMRRYTFPDKSVNLYHFGFTGGEDIVVGSNKGIYLCTNGETPRLIGLEGEFVAAVYPDDDGRIYAGTEHGVYLIDGNRAYRTELIEGTEDIYVKSLAKAAGRLYVGPFASDVFSVDLETGRKYPLPFKIPPIPVNAMKQRGEDSLLIGVDGAGVYVIDAGDGHLLRHYRDGDNSREELSGSTISDILVDKDGGVWISTSHSGVNYLPPYESEMSIIRPERGNTNSLPSGHVNAVYEDSYGERWFGTDKGVSRYNPATGEWRHYLQNHDYGANVILSIGEDARGNMWVGSYGEGAACINRNTHEVTHLPRATHDNENGVGTQYLFTSYCDGAGNVWLGGINGLTTRYNIKEDRYHHYDEDCIALAMKGPGDKVILAGNLGVGMYDPATDKVSWQSTFDSIQIKYPVRSLLVDTLNNEMWIGTMGEGLIRYNYQDETARRFTTEDGLSSNTIYSVLRGHNGGTWICTESDIYRFNPTTGSLARFTNFVAGMKELDEVAFNPGGFVAQNGDIMLASPEGCIILNPNRGANDVTSSPLIFTNLMLNDRTVIPGEKDSPLKVNIDNTANLVLNNRNNNIAIDFAVINFPSPDRIDYEYRLEGYDEAFKKADASRRAKYTALEPGKYRFVVRAVDLYSDEIIDEREMTITVQRPWWQSWWAQVSYGIILAGLIILGIGYLRNRRREKRIENQIRAFSNIAHDIRTPMSMIKAPLVNVEQDKGLSDESRRNLSLARAGIDKTLDMLTEMLELPGGKVGREQVDIEMCDIREFVKSKCHEFIPLAMLKELELTSGIDQDVPVMIPTDTEKLGHIIDNLLSNAIKYTFKGGISLNVKSDGIKRWCITVKDTGMGIPCGDRKRLFNYRHRSSEAVEKGIPGTGMGLLITRRIVRLLKGKISFVSSPGEGTEFIVSLPLKYRNVAAEPAHEIIYNVETESQEAAPNDGRNRIFIIDDDADMRNFLRETLGEEYDVTVFTEPAEILDRVTKESPDLVISDVMMPKLRGDELCRIIKSDISTSHIPVILLSGLTDREDVVSGLESQADDYILKPFDLIVLKARIKNIIKTRRRLSQQVLAEDSKPEEVEYSSELDRQFMTTIMEKLNESLADSEFSVGDLCAMMGMSRTSVYNKIRSITGQSVNEFIRIVRLNKSKELLATGRYNVSEVAYMVGFSDPKYFSTCFKKQFGVSPSKLGS